MHHNGRNQQQPTFGPTSMHLAEVNCPILDKIVVRNSNIACRPNNSTYMGFMRNLRFLTTDTATKTTKKRRKKKEKKRGIQNSIWSSLARYDQANTWVRVTTKQTQTLRTEWRNVIRLHHRILWEGKISSQIELCSVKRSFYFEIGKKKRKNLGMINKFW